MAEDIDNTQKPKAELIKHPQAGSAGAKGPAESGERRKVTVVKKKPAIAGGATPPAGKKLQAKVVVAGHPGHAPAKEEAPGGGADAHDAPPPEVLARETEKPATPETAAPAAPQSPAKAVGGSAPTQPHSFPFTQRPAAAAGRVGGKLVGRKPHEETRPPQNRAPGGPPGDRPFTQRPGGPPGRPGGRPPQQFGPRPGGGGRPGFGPHPGGPPRPGGPPGRPGFGPPRPGAGRPGPGGAPPSGPLPEGKGPAKRSFRAKKPTYNRKE
ncbi:MAG: translation initiation factor IF-2, partial [Treponema sp.]|nr:translation initiation factor IF-2 [Treponema sp.]